MRHARALGGQVLSIDRDYVIELKIDVGLPRVPQHRTILPRGPRLERQMAVHLSIAVTVSSTNTPTSRIIDCPLPDGTVCGHILSAHQLMRNTMARSAIISRRCGE
jgi:hypothetical protein